MYAGEFPEPDGPSLEWVAAALREAVADARPVGVEITAIHAPTAPAERALLAEELIRCVEALVPAAGV